MYKRQTIEKMKKKKKKKSTWGVQGRSAADLSKTRRLIFLSSSFKFLSITSLFI